MTAEAPSDLSATLRRQAWDMYFSSAVTMSLHPGTTRESTIQRTREECAAIADEMLALRDLRVARGVL